MEENERGREGSGGERARPAATFRRVIIVISLGGLDSVVLSRETERESKMEREKEGNYRKMRGERRRDIGERWNRVGRGGRHTRKRKKRIIEKQRGEGNGTRRRK